MAAGLDDAILVVVGHAHAVIEEVVAVAAIVTGCDFLRIRAHDGDGKSWEEESNRVEEFHGREDSIALNRFGSWFSIED